MHRVSAGVIPFRVNPNTNEVEFFVGHPGGKYWMYKDFWMFLKGHIDEGDESELDTAIREFEEECGVHIDDEKKKTMKFLGRIVQNPSKTVVAFSLYYPEINPNECHSNLAEDGVTPEIDKYRWISFDVLKKITHPTHLMFYDQICNNIDYYKGND